MLTNKYSLFLSSNYNIKQKNLIIKSIYISNFSQNLKHENHLDSFRTIWDLNYKNKKYDYFWKYFQSTMIFLYFWVI